LSEKAIPTFRDRALHLLVRPIVIDERRTLRPEPHRFDGAEEHIVASDRTHFDDPAIARLVQQARLPAVGFGGGYGWYAEGSSIPYFRTITGMICISPMAPRVETASGR